MISNVASKVSLQLGPAAQGLPEAAWAEAAVPGPARPSALLPFETLGADVSGAFRLVVARLHSAPLAAAVEGWPPPAPPPPPLPPLGPARVAAAGLRVGYLSFDFNDHPTAHLVEGLFVHHDRSVAALALSYGRDDESSYRLAIERHAHAFVELAALSHADAALAARQHHPHVAVTHQRGANVRARTRRNRINVCVRRRWTCKGRLWAAAAKSPVCASRQCRCETLLRGGFA
jgi:hypothetical protein